MHEFLPADDRGIFWDFFDFPSFRQHVTGLDRPGQRVFDGRDDDVDDFGVFPNVFKLVIELVERDGSDRFRFVEIELDFLLGGKRMDHICNSADEVDRVEHIDSLRAVGHGNGDLVVFPDADGLEGFGTALDLTDHLPVGRGLAHKVEGHVVGVLFSNLHDLFNHRAFKIIQMHGDLVHLVFPGSFCGNCFHKRALLLSDLLRFCC